MIMENRHTLTIEYGEACVNVRVTGVTGVTMLLEREAQLTLVDSRLNVRGAGLTANKLDVEDGVFELKAERIAAVNYGGGKKGILKNFFK